nr:DNA helicase [Tanacetum cinerariifolium]
MTFEEIEAKFTTVRKQIENFIPMGSKEEAESFKKKGIRFEQESVKKLKTSEEVKASEEVPKEKVKEMMQLVSIEEVYVEALQVKHPIIDWKHLDRKDLNQLWALVKESLNIRLASIEWKLYESCGFHHVTSKDNEIFMLIKKDYPLRKGLGRIVRNKMHKAFPLPVIEFPLPREVPTTSEESSHCQKKREAIAVKITLLLKSRRNCQSKSNDSYAKGDRDGSDLGLRTVLTASFTREIEEFIEQFPQLTTADRADIVDRVFEKKVRDYTYFVRNSNTFGDVTSVLYTIEFQKRGLPHCHSLLWISASSKVQQDIDVDKYVFAELPDPITDVTGYAVVSELMLHGPCGALNMNASCMKDEIRTLNGTTYPTNKAACQALGLLGADEEWIEAFQEAALSATALELHKFSYSKTLKDFGLPPPPEDMIPILQNRFLMEETNYDLERLLEERNFLIPKLNEDEKLIFNEVTIAEKANMQKLIFIYGHGGTGKTFLWKAITSALRSEEKIMLDVASSGIASLLLPAAIPHGNDGGETELLYPTEYLNSLKFTSLPPHRLELKV